MFKDTMLRSKLQEMQPKCWVKKRQTGRVELQHRNERRVQKIPLKPSEREKCMQEIVRE